MQCQVDIPKIQGLQDQQLTVGREFYLVCTGEWPKSFTPDKVRLVLPEEAKYQLHLLGFEYRTPDTAELKVTTYTARPVKIDQVQISDGSQNLDLGPVQFQVQSVIEKPKDPQQKVEPYGPIGPATIGIPMSYFILVLGVLALAALLILRKVFRMVQRRRLLENLKQHDAALAPLPQFHQSLRRLQRSNPIFFAAPHDAEQVEQAFAELHRMLLLFLTRELRVPAFEWSEGAVLKDLKRHHRGIFKPLAGDLEKLLREYSQGEKNKSALNDKDILVLSQQTRKLVEKIDLIKNRGGGR